jgi:hypothetical protein
MRSLSALVLLLGLVSTVHAASPTPGNVIFVTIDGVRWQEFFNGVRKPIRAKKRRGTELFPAVKGAAARGEAWIYGAGNTLGTFRIANEAALSLPGYRTILSGEFEDRCKTNHCANIDRETIFDGLIDQGFAREDVAAFTSWDGLGHALERHPGRISRDVEHGEYPTSGVSASEASSAEAIAQLDRADPPSWSGRRDRYTYALARLYLANHRPRFLYVSLLDSDELGHRDEYRDYADSLLQYDEWITELRNTLAQMGEYGENTSIVLTTDHGRGRGWFWTSHGKSLPSAFRTWAVVIPSPRLRAAGARPRLSEEYSQLDLRPTLEGLLGLTPTKDALHPGASLVDSAD